VPAESFDLGILLPAWSALPFAEMLLSIALFPLLAPHFWHRHFPEVSAACALAFAVPFVLRFGGAAVHELLHVLIVDYVPFLVLIATLFTIGGGIHVAGTLRATPVANAALLAIATVLASLVGTTGAAMITIRPLLKANRARRPRAHTVVFFIFLVANMGGGLTPLGDPPLSLGFLHGVPFFWTLGLWKEVLFCATVVLGVYVGCDLYYWRREDDCVRSKGAGPEEPVRIEGAFNLIFLTGVLAAVVGSGVWRGSEIMILGVHETTGNVVRNIVLLTMLGASWAATSPWVREANQFSWAPIQEVGILFAGIFVTIIPALAMLRVGEQERWRSSCARCVSRRTSSGRAASSPRFSTMPPRTSPSSRPRSGGSTPACPTRRPWRDSSASTRRSSRRSRRAPSSWARTPTSGTRPTSW
jgi:Na+/H+ antiporter NhaD/arsenite permease-like protein